MVEYTISMGETGHTRIRADLRRTFGKRWTLIPNTKAGIIFPEGTDPESVLKSLSIIRQDLELRVESKRTKK